MALGHLRQLSGEGRMTKIGIKSVTSFCTEPIPTVPFAEPAAQAYAVVRAAAPDRKRDALDKLIASHAISLGLTLVTNNLDDFRIFPGISLENWVGDNN